MRQAAGSELKLGARKRAKTSLAPNFFIDQRFLDCHGAAPMAQI
jgi:hypothetical protein